MFHWMIKIFLTRHSQQSSIRRPSLINLLAEAQVDKKGKKEEESETNIITTMISYRIPIIILRYRDTSYLTITRAKSNLIRLTINQMPAHTASKLLNILFYTFLIFDWILYFSDIWLHVTFEISLGANIAFVSAVLLLFLRTSLEPLKGHAPLACVWISTFDRLG